MVRHETSTTHLHSPPPTDSADWVQSSSHPVNHLSQTTEAQNRHELVARDDTFQFDDVFGDQYNMWKFQLWPLVPLNDDAELHVNAAFSGVESSEAPEND